MKQDKMQLSIFHTSFLVLISLSTWKLSCEASEPYKPNKLNHHFCGDDFMDIWRQCCGRQCGTNAYKRTLDLKGPKIPAEKAIAFLGWKRSHVQGNPTNAVEECCSEGCSLDEVAEYMC